MRNVYRDISDVYDGPKAARTRDVSERHFSKSFIHHW